MYKDLGVNKAQGKDTYSDLLDLKCIVKCIALK